MLWLNYYSDHRCPRLVFFVVLTSSKRIHEKLIANEPSCRGHFWLYFCDSYPYFQVICSKWRKQMLEIVRHNTMACSFRPYFPLYFLNNFKKPIWMWMHAMMHKCILKLAAQKWAGALWDIATHGYECMAKMRHATKWT